MIKGDAIAQKPAGWVASQAHISFQSRHDSESRKLAITVSWQADIYLDCRNKTLGIVGYGDIGRATAEIGRAFRMKIVALRRRVQLSDDERKEGLQVLLIRFQAHSAVHVVARVSSR